MVRVIPEGMVTMPAPLNAIGALMGNMTFASSTSGLAMATGEPPGRCACAAAQVNPFATAAVEESASMYLSTRPGGSSGS